MPGSDPASRPGKEIAGQARNDGKDPDRTDGKARVSDYNNISKDSIRSYAKRPEKKITYIEIKQKKTGAEVAVPCSSDLLEILRKYVKADKLEIVEKITGKYDYFD